MPKALHGKLAREARRKGLKGERRDAYVYGTLARVEKGAKKVKAGRAASEARQKVV